MLNYFCFLSFYRSAKESSQWRYQDFSDGAGTHDLDELWIPCTCARLGLLVFFSDRWTQKVNVI